MSRKRPRRMEAKDAADVASKSFDFDWRDEKTAGQCLSDLCLSDYLSDITFTFKSHRNVQLSAHKFILSMRSCVFEAMFHGPMAEVGQTVEIEDIKPETMKVLLRFIYSDSPVLDGNNVLDCLYAAKKYALVGFVKQCSAYLENNVDSSNVCAIHEQAIFYDMKSLQTKCFEFILEHAHEVLASEGFLKVSHATLLKILKHDELAEDEVNVFVAAIRWAENDCRSKHVTPDSKQMRKSLGKALFAIRFPTMAIEDFAKEVTPVGILTSEEQVMLYQHNATGGSTPLKDFPIWERTGKEVTINLATFSHSSMGNQYGGYQLQIADQDCNTLNLFGGQNTRKLRIKSVTGTFVQSVKAITLQNSGSISNYRIKRNKILFQNPIEILNGSVYLSFSTENTSSAWSFKTQMNMKVNDKSIRILRIPVGMEAISFVKETKKEI